ncbi:HET-domain-containing protein [Daldinia eschscholtzii]|nr:HET-domain-containing protein [Daldinia eschscholtzii]
MRLIDVNTLKLKEFFTEKAPPYAILSHTWGDAEVTFQEWERAAVDDTVKSKEGYTKILGACRRAQADGLQYLWCDTNCIDKSSSAELSEAINSMFAWYRNSAVCYAYLYDVEAEDTFAQSRWFTRGWTLQELLAPSKVLFFYRYWAFHGDRNELAEVISGITRIHVSALRDRSTIYNYSIAQRMSWAANRQTTRVEDIAYCLLGIFDINMPLLYGEGRKAFYRLQREIVKASNDQSILAWDARYCSQDSRANALAPCPSGFRFCDSIVRSDDTHRSAYYITNLGISVTFTLIKTVVVGIVLAGLNCTKESYRVAHHSKLPYGTKLKRHFRIWIPLQHVKHNTYARIHHPSSTIFLYHAYPILGHPNPTDLFLSLGTSQPSPMRSLEDPTKILKQHSSYFPSGILSTIASGKMAANGSILSEAYPLGRFCIIELKRRNVHSISHQLISCGSISVIFSVYWGEDGLPVDWQHTAIHDPDLAVTTSMASQLEWGCFFNPRGHVQSIQHHDSIAAMHSMHNKLHQVHGKQLDEHIREEKDPIIIIESKVLKDLFDQPELIVNIIFRDTPKLIYA